LSVRRSITFYNGLLQIDGEIESLLIGIEKGITTVEGLQRGSVTTGPQFLPGLNVGRHKVVNEQTVVRNRKGLIARPEPQLRRFGR
jgi:hypothetical protein